MVEDLARRDAPWRVGYKEEARMEWEEYLSAIRTDAWVDETAMRHVVRITGREIHLWMPGPEQHRVHKLVTGALSHPDHSAQDLDQVEGPVIPWSEI